MKRAGEATVLPALSCPACLGLTRLVRYGMIVLFGWKTARLLRFGDGHSRRAFQISG